MGAEEPRVTLVPALGALLGDMINDLVYLDFAEEFGYRAGDDCR